MSSKGSSTPPMAAMSRLVATGVTSPRSTVDLPGRVARPLELDNTGFIGSPQILKAANAGASTTNTRDREIRRMAALKAVADVLVLMNETGQEVKSGHVLLSWLTGGLPEWRRDESPPSSPETACPVADGPNRLPIDLHGYRHLVRAFQTEWESGHVALPFRQIL
jgi:hypothetical protein